MKSFNEIEYNYHEYPDNRVYITLGINVGVVTRYFNIDNNKVKYDNNLAFANIYSNYLKMLLGDKIVVDVGRTSTIFTYISEKSTWVNDLIQFLNILFVKNEDRLLFENALQDSITSFEKAYKNGEFRALYKAYEYADTNKGYSLHDLIRDLQRLNFVEFKNAHKYLVIPNNCCLYINGNLNGISERNKEEIDSILKGILHMASFGGYLNDPQLKDDAHLLELSRQNVNMDILSFGFDKCISMLDRMVYLLFETGKISGKNKILHVDKFDSSLIVQTDEVLKLKNYFKRPVSEIQYKTTKVGLMSKYNQWLEENPIRFNMMAVELKLNDISFIELMNVIIELKYEDYVDIATKIRPIVSEAQIVMRR